jgi:SpoVK/Ycf46/Vps4 family AAA+-type ATPase
MSASTQSKPMIDPEKARELNLCFIDAMCRWCEAVVDLRTLSQWAERDPMGLAALQNEVEAAAAALDAAAAEARRAGYIVPFDRLVATYGLDEDERKILRLAVCPSLETSFRRRIARFKDNVLLDYVDVEFLLSMLHDNRMDRLRGRDHFLMGSKLLSERILTLKLPRDVSSDTLPANEVHVPDRIVTFLLGHDILDKTIAPYCTLSRPKMADLPDIVMAQKSRDEILALISGWEARGGKGTILPGGGPGVVIGMFGPPGCGKTLLASRIAAEFGRPLITADSAKITADDSVFRDSLETIFFDAKVRGAVLAFDRCESLFSQKNPRIPGVYSQLEKHPGIVLLVSNDAKSLDLSLERYIAYQVEFETADVFAREKLWTIHLEREGIRTAKEVDIAALATSFEFTGGQVRNAVVVARELASARGKGPISHDDLVAGAWAQVRADLEEYSRKSKIRLTLDDLILPDEEMKQVREVLEAAQHKTFIMTRWGFGKRLSTGKGICCLFVGEPGTGKTLCAEILAQQLGQNLYQISIPRVMSKYIGETEKNIEKIFSTARANNSMLLFDEADALFTSRVKVETSVDRFSNMEINLLLQEIERFEGITILTTNLEKNMDKAMERRIQFKVRFPFPDKKYRAIIWKAHIPKECPIDDNIDWDSVGEHFELSGGNIKNAVLRAAYKAARDSKRVGMNHVISAAEAECRHAGRLFRGIKEFEF